MKTNKLFIILAMALPMIFLVGCKKNNQINYDKMAKIVYVLEGGKFQGSYDPVVQYYDINEGEEIFIVDPEQLSGEKIDNPNYTLEGWYLLKQEDTGTYSNKWDFTKDKVTKNGLTLYAKWKKNVKYTYDVGYIDVNGDFQNILTSTASQGDKFELYGNYAKISQKRPGYTAIAFKDENGNPWDENYQHPGGEEDTAIKVIVDFIEGEYAVVSNASELRLHKSENIYLIDDIDFEGKAFSFGDYEKEFIGNNHMISNFTIAYSAQKSSLKEDLMDSSKSSLYISIFGDLTNATIKDVKFNNVSVNIKTTLSLTHKIYLSPFSLSVVNSNIENVTINGSYTIEKLPQGFDKDNNFIYQQEACLQSDATTKIINFKNNITGE